jgi:mannose-1-phosphate guanylyltransferase
MKNPSGATASDPRLHRWSVVLAGGEGTRLSDYVEQRFGERRPKQYCAFVGERSMFEHTLDRGASLAAPERTVAVVGTEHARWARPQIAGRGATLIAQPSNRETAAGVFLPLAWVKKRDPEAVVAILPSDHFIRPAHRFVDAVANGLTVAGAWTDRILLFGVEPDEVEPEYGYVVPGTPVVSRDLRSLHQTAGFVEKPSAAIALEAIRQKALWNTFVMTGHIDAFWSAGRACVPDLMARFDRLVEAVDTPHEQHVLHEIYADMPHQNFSRAILERMSDRCLLARLDGVEWSDWGKAERIEQTMVRMGALRAPAKTAPLAAVTAPPSTSATVEQRAT